MADRLPAQNSQSSQDAHEDLLAALAASRELGPEMDQALAQRYLEKHSKQGTTASPAAQGQAGVGAHRPNFELAAIGPIVGIAAYIAILIILGREFWWTFFLIPMISGLWWSGERRRWDAPTQEAMQARWHQREAWHQSRRQARDQYRAWRHGYPYYPPRDADPQRASTPPATDARTPSDVL